MAALGMASIQSLQAQSPDPSKSWSVSSALRGFYDDNINSSPSNKEESWGFEINPSVTYSLSMDTTELFASYAYSYKWYDNNSYNDQAHNFNVLMNHTFSERLNVAVQDSFVIGQEPDQLRLVDAPQASFQKISGDNIRNYGSINFNTQATRELGFQVGYANALFDYADDSDFGNAALLNRLEHTIHLNGRWTIKPTLIGIVGYEFGMTDYTADLPIGYMSDGSVIYSDSRNVKSHYGYVGADYSLRQDLVGSIRGGFRYSDYDNSPNSETTTRPYAQSSLTYTYAKESSLQFGVTHDESATDSFSVKGDSITLDTDSTVVYTSVSHRLAPDLFLNANGQFQYSVFNGGTYDGDAQRYYSAGVNLQYRINRHVSANVGYSYDKLDSDVPNSDFDRNRVYMGATVTY